MNIKKESTIIAEAKPKIDSKPKKEAQNKSDENLTYEDYKQEGIALEEEDVNDIVSDIRHRLDDEEMPIIPKMGSPGLHTEKALLGSLKAGSDDLTIFGSSFPPVALACLILVILLSILGCICQIRKHYNHEHKKFAKKVNKMHPETKDVEV